MDDEDVREVGQVTDIHGNPLTVGVRHGHVSVAGCMLDHGQAEEFAQLFASACWQADEERGWREAAEQAGGGT